MMFDFDDHKKSADEDDEDKKPGPGAQLEGWLKANSIPGVPFGTKESLATSGIELPFGGGGPAFGGGGPSSMAFGAK